MQTTVDSRELIGALGGVRILVLMCATSQPEPVVDDALFSLQLLLADEASIEDFVCLGGLQVCTDLLLDREQSTRVQSRVLHLLPNVLVSDELKRAFFDLVSLFAALVPLHLCKCSCPSTSLSTPCLDRLASVLLSLPCMTSAQGVTVALVRHCKNQNTTLVYRNLVVLLIVAQVDDNLRLVLISSFLRTTSRVRTLLQM